MVAPDLAAVAAALIVYDAERAPERVTIARTGVGTTARLRSRDADAAETVLAFAVAGAALSVVSNEPACRVVVDRLVTREPLGDELYTIRVAGRELVGAEEPYLAEERARVMRAVIVAELERALEVDPPVTQRKGAV